MSPAPRGKVIHLRDRDAGKTLADLLKSVLAGQSWSQVKQHIASRRVQIDGNLCLDPQRRLRGTEVIKLLVESASKPPDATDLTILHRDPHLVIVDKPAGVTSNREPREAELPQRRKQLQPTLDELLSARLGVRVRPVHRLDRETSGVMVYALSPQAERQLVGDFKQHRIERLYRAVVVGAITEARTIESWLVRDRGDGVRGSFKGNEPPPDAQRAITHVTPIEPIAQGKLTLIECRLETGRTHQIRIHLSEAGFPLCGEKTYTVPGIRFAPEPPRHALHATTLVLTHPTTGEQLRFDRPWPGDLMRWLRSVSG
jgi:23S rRNA pseudouridine1911/1915/1917 synthase